jgi:hypothetical protein
VGFGVVDGVAERLCYGSVRLLWLLRLLVVAVMFRVNDGLIL